jgi:hypothetical protein
LNRVWVEGKEEDLAPPPYLESEADTSEQGTRNDEEAVESGSEGVSDGGQ